MCGSRQMDCNGVICWAEYGHAQKLELGSAGSQEFTCRWKEAHDELPEEARAQIRSIAERYVRQVPESGAN